MPFQIVRNDITKMKVDVIVNTANPKPVRGSGTDSVIYDAAGKFERKSSLSILQHHQRESLSCAQLLSEVQRTLDA